MPNVDWLGRFAPRRLRRYTRDWTSDSRLRPGTPETADLTVAEIEALTRFELETGIDTLISDPFAAPTFTLNVGDTQLLTRAQLAGPITLRMPTTQHAGPIPFLRYFELQTVGGQLAHTLIYTNFADPINDRVGANFNGTGGPFTGFNQVAVGTSGFASPTQIDLSVGAGATPAGRLVVAGFGQEDGTISGPFDSFAQDLVVHYGDAGMIVPQSLNPGSVLEIYVGGFYEP